MRFLLLIDRSVLLQVCHTNATYMDTFSNVKYSCLNIIIHLCRNYIFNSNS